MSAARPTPAIDLVERALGLLAAAPARAHLLHLAGSAPFALALAAFVLDYGVRGRGRWPLVVSAGAVAVLYLVAKVAHAFHARLLRRTLPGAVAGGSGEPSAGALIRAQLLWQPHALWALPLAAVATFPYGWVSAFFQALSVTGDRRLAARLAGLWPRQNHLAALLASLCWAVALLDAWLAVLLAPWLLRAFLGVETLASLAPSGLLDPAPLVAAWALAYLAVSPLGRALQVLRADEGLDRASGTDLRGRLRALRSNRAAAVAALLVAVPVLAPEICSARQDVAADVAGLDADRLDAALDRAFARPEYEWPEPGGVELEAGPSWLVAFFSAVASTVERSWEAVSDWLDRVRRWLRGDVPEPASGERRSAAPAGGRVLLLLAIAGAALAIVTVWRGRRRRSAGAAAAIPVPPAAEPVELDERHADRLASDEWLRLAAELERSGDLRAAARAAQLAALSALSRAGRVRLAAAKTNRDYLRELARGARGTPAVVEAWTWTVGAVEPVWYGSHAAGAELLAGLRARVGILERDAAAP